MREITFIRLTRFGIIVQDITRWCGATINALTLENVQGNRTFEPDENIKASLHQL